MPSTLYLDAAWMGKMAPSAQWALQDFVRVAGEEGCTLYFKRFFKDGRNTVRLNYCPSGFLTIRELSSGFRRVWPLLAQKQLHLPSGVFSRDFLPFSHTSV